MMGSTSLDYALKVIDNVAESDEPVGFSALNRMLGGISPSTLSRLLRVLTAHDVLVKEENGRYGMGSHLSFWGLRARKAMSGTVRFRAELVGVSEALVATTMSGMYVDDKILVVDRVLDANSPALGDPGTLYPINLAVAGAVFVVPYDAWSDARVKRDLLAFPGVRCSVEDARRVIDDAYRNGIMDDEGLFFSGARRLTMPIAGQSPPRRFFTVGVTTHRVEESPELLCEIENVLRSATQRLIGV